jgi:hypothetical protein
VGVRVFAWVRARAPSRRGSGSGSESGESRQESDNGHVVGSRGVKGNGPYP